MPCNALMWSHLVWQMKSQPCSDYSLLLTGSSLQHSDTPHFCTAITSTLQY